MYVPMSDHYQSPIFPFIDPVFLMFQDDFDGPSVKLFKDVDGFPMVGRAKLGTAGCIRVRR